MPTIHSDGQVGVIARSTRRHGGLVSTAAMTVAATVAMSGGAWAQCVDTGFGINNFVPFANGAAISTLITTIGTLNSASLGQSTAFVGTPSGAKPDEQGGGHWSRVIAGTVETSANTSTNVLGSGGVDCRTTTKQEYVGTQAGMDISRLNFAGGGNIHFGVTAGYFDIKSKDRTPAGVLEEAGTFTSETQVPFAGLYMAVNAGGFNFDAQVRGDYYHMELNDPKNEGLFNQSLDAKGVAFLWNASYTFNLSQNFFLRPSIGGAWSRTEVDKLNVAGSFLVDASISPFGLSDPGTVAINPITSLTGRATITAGGTITTGNLALQPFASASVFHEFASAVSANLSSQGATLGVPAGLDLNATSTTSRVGTYAHFGLGVAGTIVNTGWLGYVKADYLTGDNIEALSVNAGLRYQFQPSGGGGSVKDGGNAHHRSAVNWSGLYLGTFTGGMTGHGTWDWTGFGETDPKHSGYLAGGTIGYNFQISHLVLGIEADYGFANAKGGRECPGAFANAFFFTCETDVSSLATLTGRVGLARERALYYVKGGVAVGEVESRFQGNIPIGAGNPNTLFPGFVGFSSGPNVSKTMVGWTLGGGIEFAVDDRWSVKGEYMHYDLGKESFEVLAGAPSNIHVKGDTVRIGVNYHFGHRSTHHEPMK